MAATANGPGGWVVPGDTRQAKEFLERQGAALNEIHSAIQRAGQECDGPTLLFMECSLRALIKNIYNIFSAKGVRIEIENDPNNN
jgi:hypothetical protein